MKYFVLTASVLMSGPAMAQTDEKAESCGYQGDVVAAVQKARLNRVRERKVNDRILAQDNNWPEKYNAVIPLVTPWVYEMDRSDLKEDLREVWVTACVAQQP